MNEALLHCRENQPFIFFIKGGMGIGKSYFVHQCLEIAADNFTIIESRLIESSRKPYSFFLQVINNLVSIYPDLRNEIDKSSYISTSMSEGRAIDDETDENIQIVMVDFLLKAAQINPLIIVFQDFHLADAASIELVPKLFNGLTKIPFGMIIDFKNESIGYTHIFKKARVALRKETHFYDIELKPFNKAEVEEYLTYILKDVPSENLINTILEMSQGNPFFIEEIIQSLKQTGRLTGSDNGVAMEMASGWIIPETIRDVVALQMEDLSEKARELLEIAAITGQDFEFHLLNKLTDKSSAIDELIEMNLIFEKKAGIGSFRHKLIQDAVNSEILWSRRRSISKRLAEVFQEEGKHPEKEAEYWLASGEKEWARIAFIKAARQYCKINAYHDAANVANKGLQLWQENENEEERVEILLEYARCTQINGQLSETIKALREVLESKTLVTKPSKSGEIYRSLATTQAIQGTWNKYAEYREKAAENFEQAGEYVEAAKDWIDLANRKLDILDVDSAIEFSKKAVKNSELKNDQKLLSKSYSILAYAYSVKGNTQIAKETANKAIKIAESAGDNETSAYAYRKLAGVLEYSSEFKESLATYDSALSFCQREDLDMQAVFCISCMSWVLFRLGDWKRAIELSYEVINDQKSNDASRSTAYVVLALIKAYRGEIKSSNNYIKTSLELARKENFKLIILLQHWANAVVFEQDGNKNEAYHQYKKLIDDWYLLKDVHDSLGGLFSSAIFFYENNQIDDLHEILKILHFIVDVTGNNEAISCLSFVNGLVGLTTRKLKQAQEHFGSAVDHLTDLGVPLQLLFAEYYLAVANHKLSEIDKSVKLMKKIFQDAKNQGMRPFSQMVEAYLLRNLNEKASEPRSEIHHSRKKKGGLTNRQMEILSNLSEGFTNKEIAAKLFLSTRTVDMHVRHIYDHLNCRSRTEAVKVAKEKGILV